MHQDTGRRLVGANFLKYNTPGKHRLLFAGHNLYTVMKNFSLLLFLLSVQCLGSLAQSKTDSYKGKISYERVINFEGTPKMKKFTLLLGNDESIFFETEMQTDESATTLKPSSDDELDLSFELRLKGDRYIIITDFIKDTIKIQTGILKDGKRKTYIVQERNAKIGWKIFNEFKMINGVKVQKAKGDFRGRKYVAWFSPDIPVKYGPWKFNGLPGLILSISDEKNEVAFHANSIKIPVDIEDINTDHLSLRDDVPTISLAEYLKLDSEQATELQKLILSKLPRGAKMETSRTTTHAIELVYEDEAIR